VGASTATFIVRVFFVDPEAPFTTVATLITYAPGPSGPATNCCGVICCGDGPPRTAGLLLEVEVDELVVPEVEPDGGVVEEELLAVLLLCCEAGAGESLA
jgi:hypothetical protein